MTDQLLTILKVCLLVLLYLFFLRVLRAVWRELAEPQLAGAGPTGHTRAAESAARVTAAPAPRNKRAAKRLPSALVVTDPPERAGARYELVDTLTFGRSAGCTVSFEDSFLSHTHARIFDSGTDWLVDDLGSTNGTYVNRERISEPVPLRKGDHVQMGNLVMEVV